MSTPTPNFYTDEHPAATLLRAARALESGNGDLTYAHTGAAVSELLAWAAGLIREYRPEDFYACAQYVKVAKAVLGE
jgi:hypothetical protein